MLYSNRTAACLFTSAMVFLFAAPTVLADHLDRFETKRLVRHIEERTDELQDRIDDWVVDRRDERIHRTEELYRRMNRFAAAVDDLKGQLRDRDEPWDLREQAHNVLDRAVELGTVIEARRLPRRFPPWLGRSPRAKSTNSPAPITCMK